MNLENWQRREFIGATYSNAIVNRYYGYTDVPNAADTDAVFSIRKIAVSGTVETVSWNDNSFNSFNAKWSERAANFAAPSGSLGFTYSAGSQVDFRWTRLSGVNKYNVVVRYSDGRIVDKNGVIYNNTNATVTETYINEISHSQYFTQPGQYSIVLQAINAAGTLTATHSYVV